MVLHNPNNWHWVNKDVREWARTWLEQHLCTLEATKGDVTTRITKVDSMDGDVDVSQRKGKVITLFDVKLTLGFQGSTADDRNITGTINIPEVAHDTEEDEYVFEIDLHNADAAKEPVKNLVRSDLLPQLRKTLSQLGPALITEHGKDIQHAPGSGPSTGYTNTSSTTNKTTSSSAAQSLNKASTSSTSASSSQPSRGPRINTQPLSSSTEFRTSAAELYSTFTDPQRLAAFTRSPPTVFEGASPGKHFALFGGGVQGTYTALKPPKRIEQRWRLSHWPVGHYSNLQLTFDQNDVDGVTVMRADWDAVPVGEEDATRQKWQEYYERSLKTTFGFGTIL